MRQKYFQSIYFAFLIVISFSMSYYYRSIYNIKSYKYVFELNKDINTLIIGDSHPMSSLDPDIIKNSKNISLDSENYFFTYYKLKYYISYNSHIKNVILGFSTHNVSKMSSEMFIFHEPTEKQVLERYYRILDFEGKYRIMSSRKYFIISVLKYDLGIPLEIYKDDFLLKKLFNRNIYESDYKFVGEFYKSDKSNVNNKDIQKKIKEYYYNDHMIYPGESDLNIEYLNKIIEMCSKKGIKVYLYSSPVFPTFKELIPKENLIDFERVKKDVIQNHKNTVYIDHTDYVLERKDYGDQDHLNSLGAKVVSHIIYGILLKDNENNFK